MMPSSLLNSRYPDPTSQLMVSQRYVASSGTGDAVEGHDEALGEELDLGGVEEEEEVVLEVREAPVMRKPVAPVVTTPAQK